MKKQLGKRSALGFILGIAVGYLISIGISLIWGQGDYFPCALELIEEMNSEISAVVFQTILSGLLGAGFGACSLIWEKENWSLARQTGVYFGAILCLMLPIAYLLHWMEPSWKGVLQYCLIFILIFIVIWIIEFIKTGYAIKKMNEKIRQSE